MDKGDKVKTPLGIGEIVGTSENSKVVILRKADNPNDWKFMGNFVFRIFDSEELEVVNDTTA